MGTQTSVKSGIGVGGLGFLILFVLKLLGMIEMGWFWVITSFIWLPLLMTAVFMAMAFCAVAIAFVGALGMAVISDLSSKIRKQKNG